MSEYILVFDIVLKSTPYEVYMWLIKETNYEPTPYSIREPNPKLCPPSYRDINPPPSDMITGMAPYTKTLFISSSDLSAPLPFDSHAHFKMREFIFVYEHGEDASSNWFRNNEDVIRIDIKSEEENLSHVVGDYLFRLKFELADYMNQIRDQLVKEFSEVVSDQIPGEIIADKRGKKEPVLETADNQVAVESKPLPKWWPKQESTKRKWKRKYVLMEQNINFGETNISLAKKYHMDRKTIGHIIEWAKSDPDFDSY